MKLEKNEQGWMLNIPATHSGHTRKNIFFKQKIPLYLRRKLRAESYIVQETLPLATYNNKPFDLRVSVQKDLTGSWQITGIAGKVARKKRFLTNIAQGGSVYTFAHLLEAKTHLDLQEVKQNIELLSLKTVKQLEAHLPDLADLGLDVGISEEGFPFFIECNGKDLRISFRKGKMRKEWEDSYANPLGNAHYMMNLLGTKQDEEAIYNLDNEEHLLFQ